MNVHVVIVLEYGVLKTCLAFSDEAIAQKYFDKLKQTHSKIFVFKAKCKLDDLTNLVT